MYFVAHSAWVPCCPGVKGDVHLVREVLEAPSAVPTYTTFGSSGLTAPRPTWARQLVMPWMSSAGNQGPGRCSGGLSPRRTAVDAIAQRRMASGGSSAQPTLFPEC
eukprot:11791443-Heterocapsa_arctica.AAC.1